MALRIQASRIEISMITGSAMRRLAAQTGLEVKKLSPSCYGIYISESSALYSFVEDEKKACEQLRKQNWTRVVGLACRRAAWKCERCGLRKPLQGHHKVYRSRWSREDGPLDVVGNILVCCQECHQREHGIKVAS